MPAAETRAEQQRPAAMAHQDGIHLHGLRCIDLTLAAYVGEAVVIRYHPRDMVACVYACSAGSAYDTDETRLGTPSGCARSLCARQVSRSSG